MKNQRDLFGHMVPSTAYATLSTHMTREKTPFHLSLHPLSLYIFQTLLKSLETLFGTALIKTIESLSMYLGEGKKRSSTPMKVEEPIKLN